MKIIPISDIHSEWSSYTFSAKDADVFVLAGDMGNPVEVIREVSERMPDTHVIYVLGNHEFYRHDYDELLERARSAAASTKKVRVLEKESVVIGDVRFLGTTLWTDYALFGNELRQKSMEKCRSYLNDHRLISRNGRAFSPADALKEHELSVRWLEYELSCDFAGRSVVVTHHAPHRNSLAPRFARDISSSGFVSSLPESLLSRADVWIHGHTHTSFLYDIAGAKVVCNPRGYSYRQDEHAENPVFDRGLTIDVSSAGISVRKSGKTDEEKRIDAAIGSLRSIGVIQYEGMAVIRMADVPEEHRESLDTFLFGKTVPVVAGEGDCLYYWDYEEWLPMRARQLKNSLRV